MGKVDLQGILKKNWGYGSFRGLQEEVIRSVLEDRDTLALMPTGGGKSVCYQVPALCREGITLVISPLIALMKDQVEHLQERGVKAAAVFSGMSSREIDITLDNCVYGDYKILYMSPERLASGLAVERIRRMKVNLIAVDEAHCISQWGYDFRPAYLKIAELRAILPDCPVLALTATATQRVREDICRQLRFSEERVFVQSFARDNLSYRVLEEENKLDRMLKIAQKIKGSGIIYVQNRRETKNIASFLRKNGVSAIWYHAGMDPERRNKAQDSWTAGRVSVIVATSAFGMGIDKPDVRFVVHAAPPESLEAYYQEAGRAGRDGERSYAVLLYGPGDSERLLGNIDLKFPSRQEIRNIYQAIGNYLQLAVGAGEGLSFDFDIGEFGRRYRFNILKVMGALRLMEKEHYLALSEKIYLPSRLKMLLDKTGLYKFQVARAAYDLPVKTILRSYGGVFDHFIPIDEKLLAGRAGITTDEFKKILCILHKQRIIAYLPQTDKPQITFLTPRLPDKNIYIDPAYLRERRTQSARHVTAVLQYAENRSECRSRLLQSYFGEKDVPGCGICDHCLNMHETDLSEAELRFLKEQLTALLRGKNASSEELLNSIEQFPEKKTLSAIRILLDEGFLSLSDGGYKLNQ